MHLRLSATAALLVCASFVASSCGDPASAAPDLPSPLFRTSQGDPSDLLRCRPMAYDSVTQTIGPAGGEIKIGRHTLKIPGGALKTPTAITVVAPSDTVNRLRFAPEGLTFQKSVSLVMSYANCTLDRVAPKEIVYLDDSLRIIAHQPSRDDPAGKRVAGLISHFSQYAVAW